MLYSKILDGLIRVKKYFFQNFFCGFVIFLIHIMGICCGPFDFFCLGGQYYDLGHPTADAGNPIRRCGVRVYDSDHYTISAWMKKEGSMDHFMPHKLLVLMIFGQRPHHGL